MKILPAILMVVCVASSGCEDASSESAAPATAPASAASELSFVVQPGMTPVDARVELADGFEPGDTWYVVSDDEDAFLGLWTAREVARDACIGPDHEVVTPGPAVKDLAEALAAQGSTRSSQPEAVTLAGYDGLYLEVTGPADVSKCDEGRGLTHERGIYSDNQVDRLWILDVAGQRLVVDASYGPTATAAEVEALDAMVSSLEFA